MDDYYNLTAVFAVVPQHELDITVTGSGSTDPAVGTHLYNENNTATVTAVDSVAGWVFDHWLLDTVDVGSANPINVLMNVTHDLTAVFVEAPVTIGVEVGDWFAYDVTVTRETNATTPDIPNIIASTHDFIYDNNFTSLNRTVIDIYGTTVEFNEKWAIADGTVVTDRNITADVTAIDLFWVVIPAGLETDDNLTTLGPYPQGGLFYINDTLLVEYLEENRETCNIAYDYQHTNAAAGYNCSYQWDQDTGILVTYNVTAHWTQPTEFTKTNFLFEIVATNRWVVIPEFPTVPVMLLMFIALAASIEIFRRKKLKF
jgi:hypothetical protein